ncbi:MAG TPA: SMC-Scp complex subunit ScpB [Bdellovibrionales bacterium]|nr:SMC-Scp complex subunit ScpB [Bdellovibrionales bacterium]
MSDIEKKQEKLLKGLIADAGAALNDLDAPAPAPEPAVETPTDISEATELAAEKVDWNEETEGMEFTEAVSYAADDAGFEAIAELDAKEEVRVAKLQALADRVAKTRAENETVESDGQMGFIALEEELEAVENDADPEPTEFVDQDQLLSIIESLLFSTDKPVSVASIKTIFKGTNIRSKDISRALDNLASEYASPTRGVSLEEINGGYQLRTKSDNADFLKRLAKVRPFRLSGPALEVMAIVAYKQPVTKHEVDEIRGVESGHLMRALMERGMVCFQGKSDLPGRPMAYGTTRKFLETFGLRNLRELPTLSEIDELLPEGIGEVEEEKEKLSDLTDRLSNQVASGSYSEGEEELEKINAQLKEVDTTTEFFEQEKVRERERRDRDRAQDLRERIMLGEEVEKSDRRWLDRYDAKLLAADQAVANGEAAPVQAEAAATDGGAEFRSELETLTEESAPLAASSEDEAEAEEALRDFNEDIGDDDELDANMDWDEDAEGEKEV